MGATFPPSSTLEAWRDRYVRVWDEYIDELEPDEDDRVDRRQVIVSTFERALTVAREREAWAPLHHAPSARTSRSTRHPASAARTSAP
ncbi:hypothetical protein ACIPJ1_05855 [Microbacterium maritypicum]|uniref:hypothetical protein n=2 Tax=Microbacteriaceae TaxID=85023 RepID=UPI0038140F44